MCKQGFMQLPKWGMAIAVSLSLLGCGGQSSNDDMNSDDNNPPPSAIDNQLSSLITELGLDVDIMANRSLPDISDPVAQLGMKLFFSKSLSGNLDTACVSCHHPTLGGADELSLPVGVDAKFTDVLGVGRTHISGIPPVPRNSPTVFNTGLWDTSLFWDSRVESIGQEASANGSLSGIRTPDVPYLVEDLNALGNLAAAQAKFPVTSAEEMKGEVFEHGNDNDAVRAHLAARIGNYGNGFSELERNEWLADFQAAFSSTVDAQSLITFDNIAFALGEYERSMVFISSPWKEYVSGNKNAISEEAKQGALLFLQQPEDGGTGCVSCHSGPRFSDSLHHTVAFPQIGPGKGDGTNDDFGRERETQETQDRYRFRTPSLLNISTTAPYGHAGAYDTLADVIRHYDDPNLAIDEYFDLGGWCSLSQFSNIENCDNLYPNAEANTLAALNKLDTEISSKTSLFPDATIGNIKTAQLIEFLESLTDPCVEDRECVAPWIAQSVTDDPDNQLLIALDKDGNPL